MQHIHTGLNLMQCSSFLLLLKLLLPDSHLCKASPDKLEYIENMVIKLLRAKPFSERL